MQGLSDVGGLVTVFEQGDGTAQLLQTPVAGSGRHLGHAVPAGEENLGGEVEPHEGEPRDQAVHLGPCVDHGAQGSLECFHPGHSEVPADAEAFPRIGDVVGPHGAAAVGQHHDVDSAPHPGANTLIFVCAPMLTSPFSA